MSGGWANERTNAELWGKLKDLSESSSPRPFQLNCQDFLGFDFLGRSLLISQIIVSFPFVFASIWDFVFAKLTRRNEGWLVLILTYHRFLWLVLHGGGMCVVWLVGRGGSSTARQVYYFILLILLLLVLHLHVNPFSCYNIHCTSVTRCTHCCLAGAALPALCALGFRELFHYSLFIHCTLIKQQIARHCVFSESPRTTFNLSLGGRTTLSYSYSGPLLQLEVLV